MLQSKTFNIRPVLAPAQRWLGLSRVAMWTARGIGAGAFAAALALAADHVRHSGVEPLLSVVLLVLGILAGVTIGVIRWPGMEETARVTDSHFQLQNRLTTALQYRVSQAPLVRLQREDISERMRGMPLHLNGRTQLIPRELALAAAAVIALGVLAMLPASPSPSPIRQSSYDDARRIQQAAVIQIPALTRQLQANLHSPQRQDPGQQKLQKELAVLRHRLLRARTRSDALRAVSLTQQQLQQQGERLQPVNSQSVAALNRTLRAYQPGPQSKSPVTGSQRAARSLDSLARRINRFTQAEREKLARTLDQGSNSTSDPRVRAALQRAASALANRDPAAARRALKQASSLLKGSAGSAGLQKSINQVSSALDRLKNALSNVHKGPVRIASRTPRGAGNSPRTGSKSTNGLTNGRFRGSKQGTRSVNGSSVRHGSKSQGGSLQSSGSGRQTGTSAGVSQRSGGEGGFAYFDAPTSKASQSGGKFTTVYIPGQQGKNVRSIAAGTTGLDKGFHIVPYRQVFVRYARSASTALGHSSLPPGLQKFVREYFVIIAK